MVWHGILKAVDCKKMLSSFTGLPCSIKKDDLCRTDDLTLHI